MPKARRWFTRSLIGAGLALALVAGAAVPAQAWDNPANVGCLGGTVRASKTVTGLGGEIGLLKIFQTCGNYYYAQFKTNGVPRSLGIQIWRVDMEHINAWRSMTNQYQVWTDMIPAGGRVYAGVYYGGAWLNSGWLFYCAVPC